MSRFKIVVEDNKGHQTDVAWVEGPFPETVRSVLLSKIEGVDFWAELFTRNTRTVTGRVRSAKPNFMTAKDAEAYARATAPPDEDEIREFRKQYTD